MGKSEAIRESLIPFDPQHLPDSIRDIGIAFNFELAKPELQQKLVSSLQDSVTGECAPPAREATEQLISQLLTKAGPKVLKDAADKADQAIFDLLPELTPAVQKKMEIALRRQKALRLLQANRPSPLPSRQSARKSRGPRVRITSDEVVQAVASLDSDGGVTKSEIQKHFGISYPRASKLLKNCVEAQLLQSTEPKAGVSTLYSKPDSQRPATNPEPTQEGDSVSP